MIDAKRIADLQKYAQTAARIPGAEAFLPAPELLQLVECYEAARAYANWRRRWHNACNDDDAAVSDEALLDANNKLMSLFPEVDHG